AAGQCVGVDDALGLLGERGGEHDVVVVADVAGQVGGVVHVAEVGVVLAGGAAGGGDVHAGGGELCGDGAADGASADDQGVAVGDAFGDAVLPAALVLAAQGGVQVFGEGEHAGQHVFGHGL